MNPVTDIALQTGRGCRRLPCWHAGILEEAHNAQTEEEKPAKERGTYLHPLEHGQPRELGLDYQRNRDISGHDLAEAVRTVAGGGMLIEPSVARKVVAEFARLAPPARPVSTGLPEPLSDREQEILRLLAQGLGNREIGARLNLAEGIVKNYVTHILQKLGVRDRTQAALRARELGLL